MVTAPPELEQCTDELKKKGKKVLRINVYFFVILFLGILLVPLTSLLTSAIVISIVCVACLVFIYLS